jgi:hypothetical protein
MSGALFIAVDTTLFRNARAYVQVLMTHPIVGTQNEI